MQLAVHNGLHQALACYSATPVVLEIDLLLNYKHSEGRLVDATVALHEAV